MIPAKHALECADIVTSSDDYARRFAGDIGRWLIETQSALVKDVLNTRSWTSAVDVGGGHGQLVAPLHSLGYETTVLGSADICAQRLQDDIHNRRCSFVTGSLTEIPLRDNSFDLATCIRFISHCDDWRALVRELCRLSRHGVLIDYPPLMSSNIVAPFTFRIKKLIEGNTRPFSIFTHREIVQEFAKHNFTLSTRRGQFYFPMAIHRLCKSPAFSQLIEASSDVLALRKNFGSPVIALFVKNSG